MSAEYDEPVEVKSSKPLTIARTWEVSSGRRGGNLYLSPEAVAMLRRMASELEARPETVSVFFPVLYYGTAMSAEARKHRASIAFTARAIGSLSASLTDGTFVGAPQLGAFLRYIADIMEE